MIRTTSNITDGTITRTGSQVINNYCGTLRRIAFADSPYTAVLTEEVILVDTSGGAIHIDLPTITSNSSKTYIICDATGNASTNNITIDGNSSETIDGSLTKVLDSAYGSYRFVADSYGWHSIGGGSSSSSTSGIMASSLVNLKTLANYSATLNGPVSKRFVPSRVIVTCETATALSGDAQITIGTTSGGTNILSATPLSTLTTVNQSLVIGMFGLFPYLLCNALIYFAVTNIDSGTSGTATITIEGTSV
jgi:hypothetical protein